MNFDQFYALLVKCFNPHEPEKAKYEQNLIDYSENDVNDYFTKSIELLSRNVIPIIKQYCLLYMSALFSKKGKEASFLGSLDFSIIKELLTCLFNMFFCEDSSTSSLSGLVYSKIYNHTNGSIGHDFFNLVINSFLENNLSIPKMTLCNVISDIISQNDIEPENVNAILPSIQEALFDEKLDLASQKSFLMFFITIITCTHGVIEEKVIFNKYMNVLVDLTEIVRIKPTIYHCWSRLIDENPSLIEEYLPSLIEHVISDFDIIDDIELPISLCSVISSIVSQCSTVDSYLAQINANIKEICVLLFHLASSVDLYANDEGEENYPHIHATRVLKKLSKIDSSFAVFQALFDDYAKSSNCGERETVISILFFFINTLSIDESSIVTVLMNYFHDENIRVKSNAVFCIHSLLEKTIFSQNRNSFISSIEEEIDLFFEPICFIPELSEPCTLIILDLVVINKDSDLLTFLFHTLSLSQEKCAIEIIHTLIKCIKILDQNILSIMYTLSLKIIDESADKLESDDLWLVQHILYLASTILKHTEQISEDLFLRSWTILSELCNCKEFTSSVLMVLAVLGRLVGEPFCDYIARFMDYFYDSVDNISYSESISSSSEALRIIASAFVIPNPELTFNSILRLFSIPSITTRTILVSTMKTLIMNYQDTFIEKFESVSLPAFQLFDDIHNNLFQYLVRRNLCPIETETENEISCSISFLNQAFQIAIEKEINDYKTLYQYLHKALSLASMIDIQTEILMEDTITAAALLMSINQDYFNEFLANNTGFLNTLRVYSQNYPVPEIFSLFIQKVE